MLSIHQDGEILKARDRRNAPFFWADKRIVEIWMERIGTHAFALYMLLCYYADNRTGRSWPSIGTLAKHLCVSQNTVRKYLRLLVSYKLIHIAASKKKTKDGAIRNYTHVYTILDIPDEGGVLQQVKEGTSTGEGGVLQQVKPNKNYKNKNNITTPRKRDPIFDAIAKEYFNCTSSDEVKLIAKRVAKIKKELLQADSTITDEILIAAADWHRTNRPGLTMPQHENSIGSLIVEYRKHNRFVQTVTFQSIDYDPAAQIVFTEPNDEQ